MYKIQNDSEFDNSVRAATENRATLTGTSARSSCVSRPATGDRGAASGVFPKLEDSIYVTLAEERAECLALLEEAIATPAVAMRATLLYQLQSQLSSQFQATEQTLYAALQHFEETQAQACECVQRERRLEQMLRAAGAAPEVAPGASARRKQTKQTQLLKELRDHLIAHASESEREIFVEAHRVLPRLQEENLRDRYLERRAELCSHNGPSAA